MSETVQTIFLIGLCSIIFTGLAIVYKNSCFPTIANEAQVHVDNSVVNV